MRNHLHSLLASLLVSLLAIACAAPAGAPSAQNAAQQPAPVIDDATFVTVEFQRDGGLAGLADRAQLYLDGHVVLERRGQEPVAFQLTPDEVAQIDATFEAADFQRNVRLLTAASTAQDKAAGPQAPAPDAFAYRITRNGILAQTTLETADNSAPEWAQPLIALLSNLLLTPAPDTIVAADQLAATTPTASPDPGERIVLIEFRRNGGFQGSNDQVLVHMDRSYSVARDGVVIAGRLSQEEMAALLHMMEAANLKENQGEYLPADPCCDRFAYELVYRNLFGAYQVRTMDGAIPDWFQPIVDAMVGTLIEGEQVAVGAPETTAQSPATPSPASTAAWPTRKPPEATVAPTQPTPQPTPVPEPPPTSDETFGLAAFVQALTGQGRAVQANPSRIAKPYLSVLGTVVRVDGQPVQVFEYPDEVTLDIDLASLAPDASSAGGVDLTWPAAPHFWRRGLLLALAATDDSALVEAIDAVLGPQIAGRTIGE